MLSFVGQKKKIIVGTIDALKPFDQSNQHSIPIHDKGGRTEKEGAGDVST